MRARTIAVLAAASTLALVVPALALTSASPATVHTVILKNIRFHPGTLTIKRGESVTWVWRDGGIEHNVTGGGFRSQTKTKGTFTVRFTHPGTFNYRCTIHEREGMRARIIVH